MRRRLGGKAFRSMRWRTLLPLLLLVVAVAALSPSPARAIGPPVIVDLVPDTGLAGTVITIVGRDFTGATAVTFGAGAATFNVLNDRKIEATTPVQTRGRIVDIIVITPDGTSRNTDDDDFTYRVPHLVIDQGNGLAVSEDGDSDSYTLALDLLPTGTVTVTIPDTDDLAISPNTLVFTTSDYAVPRRVTVSAIDDVHSENTHTALIRHHATGGGYGAAGEHPLAVTVTDNDRFVIVVTQPGGRTNVLEGGRPAFLSVRLSADPGDDATVTVTGDDQLTTSTSTVSFGHENWGTPVEFAVLAVDDDLSEGDHTGTLTLTLSGPRVLPPVLEVTIFISDEHSPAVHIAESGGGTTVAEAGGQDTYTIALARQPVGPVTVSIRPEDDLRSSPAQIVFRPDNWDQPQTVTVEAIDDALIEGDQVHHIHHVATGSGLDEFGVVLLGVSIIDNDTPDHALLPLSAGLSLIGWFGAPTTARAILDGNPALTRIWIWDQVNGWRGDSRALPSGLRRDIPIARGAGIWVVAAADTQLVVPLR